MEINCCGIALAAIIVNLISLLVFFGYSVKMNKNAFSFSSDKKALPIMWKDFQTNYDKKYEEKISQLERTVNQLKEHDKK